MNFDKLRSILRVFIAEKKNKQQQHNQHINNLWEILLVLEGINKEQY